MIHGYAEETSIRPGSTLTLRVATDAPRFHVGFFRQGANFEALGDLGLGSQAGRNVPFHPADQDWGVATTDAQGNSLPGWPGYDVPLPADLASGVYVAIFTEENDAGQSISTPDTTTADGRDAKAMFVVTSPSPGTSASILYKINLFTFQAYNMTAAPLQGLYPPTGVPGEADAKADKVTLRRPGGGTGGTPHDTVIAPDVYDVTSPRETFAHWDAYFIAWLEGNGFKVDYCTDLDIHTDDGSLLAKYRLLLSNGHDEYWSAKMYGDIHAFIDHGGNAAFFSGNTCWWQTIVADGNTTIARGGNFFDSGRSENEVLGVSYRNGGGQWNGRRQTSGGYTVLQPDHWVFAGTGVVHGQVFGDVYGGKPDDPAVVCGYECDGAAFDRSALDAGLPLTPTGEDGTPASYAILAVSDLTGWEDAQGNAAATMGVFQRGGTVYNAATTDWARVLGSGREPVVDRITRNVLNRLSG